MYATAGRLRCGACLLALAVGLLGQHLQAAEVVPPPAAKRNPVILEHHGIRHTDDYAWLLTSRLEQVLERPEALEKPMRAHLEPESRYAQSALAPNRSLERRLAAEWRGGVSPGEE